MPSDSIVKEQDAGSISAFDSLLTPIGFLHVVSNGSAITRISFEDKAVAHSQSDILVSSAIQMISSYFAGAPLHFGIPLATAGSEFQQLVWQRLTKIPHGKTISYKELAQECGGPTFTRAVAAANSANPIALVIPCHRVIGSNSGLTGYAGGLWRKKWLLEHESPATQISLF